MKHVSSYMDISISCNAKLRPEFLCVLACRSFHYSSLVAIAVVAVIAVQRRCIVYNVRLPELSMNGVIIALDNHCMQHQ